ncbi:hypothetical protein [Streptomyces luteireticuli]|uniref:DUF1918 domain-containing protein n=1 Tax=Streptomyces luteireticuli TaxID=173858 RepID=A0ABP3IJ38_9ACTN
MPQQYKTGDTVTIIAVRGRSASWLFQDQHGTVLEVHEGHSYPYKVALHRGGSLCFKADEFTPNPCAPAKPPGRRLLDEAPGFPMGADTAKAHKIMRRAVRDSSRTDDIVTALEEIIRNLRTEIDRLKEAA